MIPKDHDDYCEIKYADNIYVQVWSHDSGEGAFEIYAIIPHEEVDESLVDRDSGGLLSTDIQGVEQFYDDIEQLVTEVTGNQYEIVFYLLEVVDDGTWERNASSYATHKFEA